MSAGPSEVKLFTRQATGLVRDVSPLSSVVFAVLTAPFPWVLAVAIFWTFSAYPGGNLYIGFGLGYIGGLGAAIGIGMLGSVIPRSGGDYILVGRTLHPVAGLISSFWFTAGVIVSISFIIETLIQSALGPSLIVAGSIGHHSTLLDWGTQLETSKTWLYISGLIALAICAVAVGSGWKWALRFQNYSFLIGMAGMVVCLFVVLMNSGQTFIDHFNTFAQSFTGKADSYNYIIATAQSNGVNVNPGTNFANTIPVIGAVFGFSIYGWFAINIGGEVRQARSFRFAGGMVLSVLFNFAGLLLFTVLFTSSMGGQFFTAINSLSGTSQYPFPTPPFYVFLVSVASGSEWVAWILGLSLVAIMLGLLWLNCIQPVRALFAYSFDGVLPLKISDVNQRTHSPVIAVVIVFLISAATYTYAVFGGQGLFGIYATAIVLALCPMVLMSIGAIILPFRYRSLWAASTMNRTVGKIPLLSIGGVLALVVSVFGLWVFFTYPGLGLTNHNDAIRNLAILAVAAVVVFAIAAAVRSSQGLNLLKTTAEIPPE
jgi:amino acid transporter